MNAEGDTVIRPYQADDLPDLVQLFARVFNAPITAEHWRWKLLANPSPACNVWLAASGGRPVFQYAGIAQRYRLDGAGAVGFVSVDAMTDPDFRRRGLLTRVVTRAHAAWRDAGAAFAIGLPNQQWGSRTRALGWEELFPLRWFVRLLEPQAWLARRLRFPLLRYLSPLAAPWNALFDARIPRDAALGVSDVTRAGPEFDELWVNLCHHFAFSAVRDAAWVNWRFLDSPVRRYQVIAARRGDRLAGYLAYRMVEREARVAVRLAEIITAPGDTGAAGRLLAELIARARARRAESIATLAIPGTAPALALRRAGFFEGPDFSVQLVRLANAPALEDMRDRHRWLMSGADYDVI
jgi:hypothetical protein